MKLLREANQSLQLSLRYEMQTGRIQVCNLPLLYHMLNLLVCDVIPEYLGILNTD